MGLQWKLGHLYKVQKLHCICLQCIMRYVLVLLRKETEKEGSLDLLALKKILFRTIYVSINALNIRLTRLLRQIRFVAKFSLAVTFF